MKYALLIYDDEQLWAHATPEAREAIYAEHGKLGAALEARGALHGGEELHPTAMATTLRKRAGEVLITDGPFAETTEQLGGFYLIEAEDLDAAIAYARMLPDGTVEIRPVVDHEGGGC